MPHSRFACSGDLKRRHLPWDIQNRSTQEAWGTFGFVSDVYYMLIICIKSRCQYNLFRIYVVYSSLVSSHLVYLDGAQDKSFHTKDY